MNATEAKKKLCELRENLGDREADKAVWIAIRAIDTSDLCWHAVVKGNIHDR